MVKFTESAGDFQKDSCVFTKQKNSIKQKKLRTTEYMYDARIQTRSADSSQKPPGMTCLEKESSE